VIAAASDPVIPNFGRPDQCVVHNPTFCWSWVRHHWSDTLAPRLVEHIELTAIAVGIGFVLAFGLALFAHRVRKAEQPIGLIAAVIYTIPSIAFFQLLIPLVGISNTEVEIPLVGYSLVVLFPNMIAGLRAAPPDVLEAARGMGLTRRQLLWRIELPLAVPAIVGGLRLAVVSTIAIATIASFRGHVGLGDPIFLGLAHQPSPFKTQIYAAGALAVALALVADALLVGARRLVVPWARKGLA
jgi:osmoprotectant transport system permease protein